MKIELEHISKSYRTGKQVTLVFRDFCAKFEGEKMYAIQGRSGSGKTTLLNIIGGLCGMDSGEYRIDGKKVEWENRSKMMEFRREHVGMVVQDFALLQDRSVFANVELPLAHVKGLSRKEREKMVLESLVRLGIEEKAYMHPAQLSGGEKQRAAIARAMIRRPGLLLADEPTGSLDEYNAGHVFEILKQISKEGTLVLLVTHNEGLAAQCDETLRLL